MARLHDQYREAIVPELTKKFGYKSVMQVPRISKITLNMGVGDAVNDKKNIVITSKIFAVVKVGSMQKLFEIYRKGSTMELIVNEASYT